MNQKVIVIGGGVAGMSAAHELIERGFEVEVYNKHRIYAGGKARSVNVPGTNKPNPELYLSGEHGFRFFPGFYKHVTDTMERIPYKNNKRGTLDNLIEVDRVGLLRSGKSSIVTIVNFPKSFADIKELIKSMHADTGLTPEEKKFFAIKIWQLMTSCYDRRLNEYEKIGWWEYLESDRFSKTYQSLLVQGLTRTLVAANAKKASTKTGGDIFLQLIFNMTSPGVNTDRVLNGPTNDVWIDPWLDYLTDKGVKYNSNYSAVKLEMNEGKLDGVAQVVTDTFKTGLMDKVSSGKMNDITGLLGKGGSSSPFATSLINSTVKNLVSKLGLPKGVSDTIGRIAIPFIIDKFNDLTSAKGKSNEEGVKDILGDLLKGSLKGKLGGLGKIFGI